MGQKVHPLGIRKNISAEVKGNYLNSRTHLNEGILDRKSLIDYGANLQKDNFSKKLHQNLLIEKHLEEFFSKSGYILVNSKIRQSTNKVYLYLDLFHRSGTSDPVLFDQEAGTSTRSMRGNRRPSWTARRVQWRNLETKDFEFYGKFFEDFLTHGDPIVWKIRILNPRETGQDLQELQNLLRYAENHPYYKDLIKVLLLVNQEPSASLLAEFVALELKETNRHQPFIDLVSAGLDESMNLPTSRLSGCLLQVKGRINGSDRSKRSVFRKGSIPLQTLKAGIDYGFAEVLTKYGVCSIKVWLRYK